MDQIQRILIKAGRKDLAQEYYEKTAAKDLSKSDAVKVINKQLNFLGISGVRASEKDLTDSHTLVKTVKIDPKLTGPLSPIFKSIEVEVKTGYSEKHAVAEIILHYSWKHPSGSGSNGYEVRYRYTNGKWEII